MAGLLDLLHEYGSGVKRRVGLLASDPVEYTRQALLDVLPSDAEAKAAKNMLMGGEVDRQAYQKYLAKMQDMGSFLGSLKAVPADDLAAFVESLKQRHPGLSLDLYGRGDNAIELSRIVVPKDARNTGVGTDVMRSISEYADKTGRRVDLSPSSDFGGSVGRLREFYKRFGFRENKGRAKDFAVSASMYREPMKK